MASCARRTGSRDFIGACAEAPITGLSSSPARRVPTLPMQQRKDGMIRMTNADSPVAVRLVTGGVDTHGRTHHAAVLDELGRPLGDREFPATRAGYRALLDWLQEFAH